MLVEIFSREITGVTVETALTIKSFGIASAFHRNDSSTWPPWFDVGTPGSHVEASDEILQSPPWL